jgi:hypothetical protein
MSQPPPRILTMTEAASELRVSRRWLQAYLKKIPCSYMVAGHRKLFDEVAMEAIREAMRQDAKAKCPSNLSLPILRARQTGAFADRSSESPLTEALRLANAGKRPKSSRVGATKQNARL